MRKTLLAIAAASLLSTPALAASNVTVYGDYNPAAPAEATTGAVAGTAVGIGVSEGWFGGALGSSTAIAGSTAGAATAGGTTSRPMPSPGITQSSRMLASSSVTYPYLRSARRARRGGPDDRHGAAQASPMGRRRYCGGSWSRPLTVTLRFFQRPSLMP